MSEAEGFADSLRQQAKWIREALTQHDGFDLGDVDTDELDDAAEEIDKLQRELTASLAREGEMAKELGEAQCRIETDTRMIAWLTGGETMVAASALETARGEIIERCAQVVTEHYQTMSREDRVLLLAVATRIRALASPAPSSGEEKSHGSHDA